MSLAGTASPPAAIAPKAPGTRLRMPLAVKFAAAVVGLVVLVLMVNGALSLWFSYQEAQRTALDLQQEKAQAASEQINQFVSELESQLGWTTRAEWRRVGLEQQRYDFIRLLRQAPAITELFYLDAAGMEQLKVSRLAPDSVGSLADHSGEPRFSEAIAGGTWFGPVYFRRGSEPYMTISIAHAGRDPGVTVAEVNLKFIWDVINGIRVGETGYAFVVGPNGKLIAHPEMSLVLRDTDMSALPQVAAALADSGAQANTATVSESLEGDSVLSAFARIPRLGWVVFVQSPAGEALAPIYALLTQSGLLLVGGLLLATVVGTWLARRLVVPISRLQAGAERLGEGDLSQRIAIRTGDEIETLADRFNVMASRIQESHETLEAKVEERTGELSRSLVHLRATQDRLVQTEKLASLGQLTAGIAHEIKNPLNFVNNFSALSGELVGELREVLERAPFDAKTRAEVEELANLLEGNLAKVVQHGQRADSIVKNMLLHSRQGSGEHAPTSVNGIVEESLNLAYHGARAEQQSFNITLEKSLDPAAGEVDLFPQEITRVLLNLVSNGFYATAKRSAEGNRTHYEPKLMASTRNLGDSVEIRIRDNGTGIPPEVKEKMFVPFFTTKPAGEGTGLGLSLSHDIIVKQHAGTIEVESEPGVFTEFRIVLPRGGASLGQAGGDT